MTSRHLTRLAVLALATALTAVATEAAPVKTTLHHFAGATDGATPMAPLLRTTAGALVGTTAYGGAFGSGVAFRLTAPASGAAWPIDVLHHFAGGIDGANPRGGLITNAQGFFFGTTANGGSGNVGVVFKLAPPPVNTKEVGLWTETVLYEFKIGKQGANPMAGLLTGKSGTYYGTTYYGGTEGYGTVFRLIPPPAGKTDWTETTLHSFKLATEGTWPRAEVIADTAGVLYGTTETCALCYGTAFTLTPPAAGKTAWPAKVLYRFKGGNDGRLVYGGLVRGAGGVLYGTTYKGGGASDYGTVFKLTPPAAGKVAWTETLLYRFKGGTDGAYPQAGLVLGKGGVLYGTTASGGTGNNGTIFRLTPPAAGKTDWTEAVLYRFKGGADGATPQARPIVDPAGALYGTTSAGGKFGKGTVFRLVP